MGGSVQFDEALDNMILRYLKSDVKDVEETSSAEGHSYVSDVTEDDIEINEVPTNEDSEFVFDLEGSQKMDYYVIQYYFTQYPERGRFELFVPKRLYGRLVSLNARLNIIFALANNFNLVGHDSSEVFLYMDSDAPGQYAFWVNNEQNFVLHYLYAYGVPIGSFFCLLILFGLIYLIRNAFMGEVKAFVFAMFYLVFILTGLMEVVWVPGQIVLVLLFFAPLFFDEEK